MAPHIYIGLVVMTAGALLALFLLVMILGYRRPRAFERVLFFVALAELMISCGGLLIINAQLYYPRIPPGTRLFAFGIVLLGLVPLPGLLVHLHVEYWRTKQAGSARWWVRPLIVAGYLPLLLFLPSAEGYREILNSLQGVPQIDCNVCASDILFYAVYLSLALIGSAALEFSFSRRAKTTPERRFHWALIVLFIGDGLFMPLLFASITGDFLGAASASLLGMPIVLLLGSVLLCYAILRYKALEFGEQRNLIYAVSGAFLALLYLALVRRAEGWFEPILPPEATAAILLFTLVFLFEPIQRRVGRGLRFVFERQVGQLQTLAKEIEGEARRGNIASLVSFLEARLKKEFGLDGVRLAISGEIAGKPLVPPDLRGHTVRFQLRRTSEQVGMLDVTLKGAAISGDRFAALSLIAEQLPAHLDLCRLIEEKLTLERELAERERLALVGQMAATISHNLKNPLGSMKTLLQVQLENPDLPESLRGDCALVVAEIDRLSAKLNQLLRYAKPPVRTGAAPQRVAAVALAEQMVTLLGHEAQRRAVRLEFEREPDETFVRGTEEALSDVLSNLLVNAIEVLPARGNMQLRLARRDAALEIEVTDDGPGIPEEFRSKIFQPFFTTKPSGTGLGLAIVERRLAEMDGSIRWQSPVRDGRGTRFTVTLPVAE
jgi:signal transduction histidine kinase